MVSNAYLLHAIKHLLLLRTLYIYLIQIVLVNYVAA